MDESHFENKDVSISRSPMVEVQAKPAALGAKGLYQRQLRLGLADGIMVRCDTNGIDQSRSMWRIWGFSACLRGLDLGLGEYGRYRCMRLLYNHGTRFPDLLRSTEPRTPSCTEPVPGHTRFAVFQERTTVLESTADPWRLFNGEAGADQLTEYPT